MFNENWWRHKNKSKELTIGWLYNNRIGSDFAKGYSKNLLDYWSIETSIYGMRKQFAADTENELIKKAHEAGFSKMLVFKQGSSLGPDFYEHFSEFYDDNPTAKFVGHILDKGDKYYSIHSQCFLIDLDWWDSAESPKWGDWTSNKFSTIKPDRSKSNHHDNYTPTWVSGPKHPVFHEYIGTEGGWSMVEALVKDKQKILSWPTKIRRNKYYGYPEVKHDGPRHINDIIQSCQPEDSFFIANTEYTVSPTTQHPILKIKKPEWDGTYNNVVVPAAGLTPLVYGFKLGLKQGDRLSVYDINKFELNMTEYIINNFDGKDYSSFANNLMESVSPTIIKDDDKKDDRIEKYTELTDKFKGINKLGYMQKKVDKLNEEGFSDWIKNELPYIDVKINQCNLFDVHCYDNFVDMCCFKDVNFVHLTNIFHYLPTSFFYSAEERWNLHNEFVEKLQKKSSAEKCEVMLSSSRGLMIDPTNEELCKRFASVDWARKYNTTSWASLPENDLTRIFKWNQ